MSKMFLPLLCLLAFFIVSTEAAASFPCVSDSGTGPNAPSTKCCEDNSDLKSAATPPSLTCSPFQTGISTCGYLPVISKCDYSGYDKNTPPAQAVNGGQTVVKIQMRLKGIWPVDKATGLYNVGLSIIQLWNDPRLAHNAKNVLIYHFNEQIDAIWQPDVYFPYAIEEYRNDYLAPIKTLRVFPDGLTRLSQRLHVKIYCQSNGCPLRLESYGSIVGLVNLTWNELAAPNYIQVDDIITDKFNVTDVTTCNNAYDGRSFPCLQAFLVFKNPV